MAKKLANDGDPEALAERGRRRMERATIRAMRHTPGRGPEPPAPAGQAISAHGSVTG